MEVLRSALHSNPESVLPSHESHKCLTNCFVTFFSDKITNIRDWFSSTDFFRLPAPPDLPKIDSFRTVSDVEIHKAIMKSCLLDLWPTFLVKECLDILLPSITKLVNCSLSEGIVPANLKKAVVTPLIKKPHYHLISSGTTNLCQACALSQNLSSEWLHPN